MASRKRIPTDTAAAGVGKAATIGFSVEISPLAETLFPEAVQLWQDAGLTRPWNDPLADLRRAMQGPDSVVLAARDESGVVATAMVGHDGHRGWVYYLAVTREQRGRGIGERMMRACETWVRQRGIAKIQLMVRDDNGSAVSFYDHLGYERSDVLVLGRRLDRE